MRALPGLAPVPLKGYVRKYAATHRIPFISVASSYGRRLDISIPARVPTTFLRTMLHAAASNKSGVRLYSLPSTMRIGSTWGNEYILELWGTITKYLRESEDYRKEAKLPPFAETAE